MTGRRRRFLFLTIGLLTAAGIAIRLFLAFHWLGNADILTFAFIGAKAEAGLRHIYATNFTSIKWAYPPGYLIWIIGALKLSRQTGLEFHGVVQVLPILADLALAFAVYVYLGWRDAAQAIRLAGFVLVMLGPVFIAISGYHGQIDAVAILPGVLALMVWERRPDHRRALEAGLLIGAGAAIKTVPLLLLLPLLTTARSRKEGVELAAVAVGVVAIVCLPFVLAEPTGFKDGPLSYAGPPSRGGLSLLVDPGFASHLRADPSLAIHGPPPGHVRWVSDHGGLITLVVLLGLAAFLVRYRPAAIDGIVILWLAVFAFSPNFLLQYLVWALPFFIMAGYIWESALIQLAAVPALVITYVNTSALPDGAPTVYVVVMVCLWIFWVAGLIIVGRRLVGQRPSHPQGTQPPLVALRPTTAPP